MIDEAVLERALRAEAETYAVPAGGPDAIRAAAAPPRASGTAGSRLAGRRRVWWAAVAAVAVTVGVMAVGGGVAERATSTAGGRARLQSRSADEDALGVVPDAAPNAESGRHAGTGSGDTAAPGLPGGGAAAPAVPGGGTAAPALPEAHVVRTGEMTVEVRDVPRAVAELARLASAQGGFVAGSTSGGDPESPTGSVTLRVPTERFDAAVAEASRLGRIVTSTTSGTDVTAEVTDVDARLRALTAARGQLQTLLARANTVGEVLAVQQRITETQTQIEQLQARQRSLADKTSYGTLRVSVEEPGTTPDEPPTGFSKAWHDAVDGFVTAAQGVVAASGTTAFVLLALGALLLLLRPLYRAAVRRIV
ncbi:MAG TPA: DUF4349 domain-containing protein [Frankiaceae bacterium]|jgi:hypothetical protein|nr:DUF4349 domain-containing protein [Frankiaceae bacterium]